MKGWKWDNCNSIINKYIFFNYELFVYGIFHLIFSDYVGPQAERIAITKALEEEFILHL